MVRKKPPSRVRYEETHPNLCFRVSLDLKQRLQKLLNGRPFSAFLQELVGGKEKERKDIEAEKRRVYEQAYEEARKFYEVTYNCKVCGKPITVNQDNEKKAIEKLMHDTGWGHKACHEKRGR